MWDASGWIGNRQLRGEKLKMMFVVFDKVCRVYKDEQREILALDRLDCDIKPEEFVSVVGPSGCGKSTMLRLMAGLDRATEGVVRVDGRAVTTPITNLGIVFQEPTLLDWRRALENVMIQIDIRRLPRDRYETRALRLLESLGLQGFEHAYPSQLSGGMRQRVGIARALVHDPPLLLMDEPFSALDALTRDRLNVDLQRIWSSDRKTVFFITHSIVDAVFLSDRVLVMTPSPGRIADVLEIDLPRPRGLEIRETPAFAALTGKIRAVFQNAGVL
jgi:NitT/TauT family transport system ATP-binding protein